MVGLDEGAQSILGRPLSGTEAGQFNNYLELLRKWGSVTRLIGSTEPHWIVENLLLDSLLFLRLLSPAVRSLLDFGAGAGLPGIPIRIVRPEIELTLLEGRRRRASFLSTAVRELGLRGARVINARAEDALPELRGSFDAVVMRCAGDLDKTLPIASAFVTPGGIVLASGPPDARPLTGAEWITVPGIGRHTLRRFAMTRVHSPA
ncbi:MAG TPA: 16S rRNA (guanine(527)-N(7))-methyltransferase RsmG [Gemmatimonadales bacterium]|nr:16S rRNA (guanine(527)-N(7))-methyltransferase RsmG [Gemmatimonadales bacterium]